MYKWRREEKEKELQDGAMMQVTSHCDQKEKRQKEVLSEPDSDRDIDLGMVLVVQL